jgi:hypothetical protein
MTPKLRREYKEKLLFSGESEFSCALPLARGGLGLTGVGFLQESE